jgi:hypothetical protein
VSPAAAGGAAAYGRGMIDDHFLADNTALLKAPL